MMSFYNMAVVCVAMHARSAMLEQALLEQAVAHVHVRLHGSTAQEAFERPAAAGSLRAGTANWPGSKAPQRNLERMRSPLH